MGHGSLAGGAPLQVAQVECDQTSGQERGGEGGESTPDGGKVREVVQGVPDSNDRVCDGHRIVREEQGPELVGVLHGLPG